MGKRIKFLDFNFGERSPRGREVTSEPWSWRSGSRRSHSYVCGDGARREGRESRAGEGAMLEPELASAPDRGLDAQPVPAPDRGLDELATRLECGLGDAGVTRP
jgi:hypothetical protein